MLQIPIGVGVDLLSLEGFQEALANGIVIGFAGRLMLGSI
jgi:hypothetical protein